MLRNFDKLFATKANVAGTVVHIGAGICSELPEYQRLKFEKIQLVEAHLGLADQLAKKLENVGHVNVSNIVVAAKEGAVPFIRTNNPRFDSLKNIGVIKEYFPNICVVNEETVNAVSLDSLVKTFVLDNAKENVLVLELQGAETDVLGSVAPANLQLFSWLIIKTSEVALYGNETDNANLSSVVKQFGFEPVFTEELTFPFSVKIYRRNDAELELCQAKQNVGSLESEVYKVKAEFVRLEQEQQPIMDKQVELIESISKAKEAQEKLAAGRQKQIEKIEQTNAKLQKDLEREREIVTLSIKLQTLKEADLKDLQQRYKQALLEQKGQHLLLEKLSEKLSLAANYFNQISEEPLVTDVLQEQTKSIMETPRKAHKK